MKSHTILWEATEEQKEKSNIKAYMDWLAEVHGLQFSTYSALWEWSIREEETFWQSLLKYFQVNYEGSYDTVHDKTEMPGVKWFSGLKLNYTQHLLRNKDDQEVAIVFINENGQKESFTWEDVKLEVAAFQQYLIHLGLRQGDRCVAYLPNIPQALFAFMACNALGIIWSSCSPDFGVKSVIDRFSQIEPDLYLSCDGYYYGGKNYQRAKEAEEILESLPTVQNHVCIGYLDQQKDEWADIINEYIGSQEIKYCKVPFDHPIWVLYSSGTTGIPKAITHGTGGILLEHLKYIYLQNEVKPGDCYFWYSTTGWMMWNFANASLLAHAKLLLYDGSPAYPDLNALWKLAKEEKINHFGTSAPFLIACMKNGIKPKLIGLEDLISIGSTGAPLPAEAFSYVYSHVAERVWLCSMAGGTDVCTAFVGSNILSPVQRGKIQGRALGVALYAYDQEGNRVEEEVGEMVIEKPMPSMPIYFWNDPGMARYSESYFQDYPGKWRHGDWISIDQDGQLVIYGRSDATLNRQGVRIGTSEIYSSVHKINEIRDALVVNLEFEDGSHFMPLFVVAAEKKTITDAVQQQVKSQLRSDYSPRHVPDTILEVPDIPYTLSGKKLETPVKKILMGIDVAEAANKEATKNPKALEYFRRKRDYILSLKK